MSQVSSDLGHIESFTILEMVDQIIAMCNPTAAVTLYHVGNQQFEFMKTMLEYLTKLKTTMNDACTCSPFAKLVQHQEVLALA